jgi:hypothetical protein
VQVRVPVRVLAFMRAAISAHFCASFLASSSAADSCSRDRAPLRAHRPAVQRSPACTQAEDVSQPPGEGTPAASWRPRLTCPVAGRKQRRRRRRQVAECPADARHGNQRAQGTYRPTPIPAGQRPRVRRTRAARRALHRIRALTRMHRLLSHGRARLASTRAHPRPPNTPPHPPPHARSRTRTSHAVHRQPRC